MNVLVTGATGFVGRAVLQRLRADGHRVRAAVRRDVVLPGVEVVNVGEIDGTTSWESAMREIDAVVHLAARVHVLHETAGSRDAAFAAFRRINVDGTRKLAEACRPSTRFVAMSSIRAVADESHPVAIDEATAPQPTTPYGISKLEGERALAEVARARGISWIALRPPLVFGEGAGGNLRRLMAIVRRGVPLPLGAVHNRRSFIYVGNLADAVARALAADAPQSCALPIADPPARSTAALAREIGAAMGKSPRLVSVPPRLLELGARVLGRSEVWARLGGDLEIAAHAADRLQWTPAVSFGEGVRRAVHDWLGGSH
ncbi:MAG TPA: NAD-dependent epimerase/dehydratase family protein [Nannocystaceae bacterium]|nr:NAD-dependent epimerase/dehydratase family protein [Nannocystaceae bacterium]